MQRVSGILNMDDPNLRKRKLNILFKLFDVNELVEKSKIPAQAFLNILADIDGNNAEDALSRYKNDQTKVEI